MKKFLWCLRIPEGILAFIGGVFISYAINIITSTDATLVQIIVASLFFVASFWSVIWVLLLQKFDAKYKKNLKRTNASDDAKDLSVWYDILMSKKNRASFVFLWISAILTALLFVAGMVIGLLNFFKAF